MKTISLLICSLLLFSCKKTEPDTEGHVATEESMPESQNGHDKEVLTDLVMKAYQWNENHPEGDLMALKFDERDTIITGIDIPIRDKYLALMKNSGYFTNNFVAKLDKVTARLNEQLESGEIIWSTEELPPIHAAEIDAWCKCMDSDEFSPYNEMVITFDKISADRAMLRWNWNMENMDANEYFPNYHITLIKQNGLWKIDYMEGFDEQNYMFTE